MGPERQLSLAGFVTRANGGSVTPAFSDPHTGLLKDGAQSSTKWVRRGSSSRAFRSRNSQRKGCGGLADLNENQAVELGQQTPPWPGALPSHVLGEVTRSL